MKSIILLIKGFIMGIANIIPGVSGGTLAIILGIYEDFIKAISHFFSNLKENLKFLIPVGIGMILSIALLSGVIDYSYNHFPIPTCLFFLGLVLGGIPLLLSKVKGKNKTSSNYIIFSITFLIVMMLTFSDFIFGSGIKLSLANISPVGYIILFLVGVIAAATMVIPGVSGSLVLMLLGYYYPIIKVIKESTKFTNLSHNIPIIFVFGMGVLIGIILISKLLEFLFKKYEVKTYYGVLGFIFASILAIPISTIIEKNPSFSFVHIIVGIITLAIGSIISYRLGDK